MEGINNLRKKQPGLKTILSFGGWNESQTGIYARPASDPINRATFVTSAWKMVNKFGFDGLHLEWLYHGHADKAHFVALIKELKALSGGKLVTAAVSYHRGVIEAGYDALGIAPSLDLLLVLTNFFHGREQTIGHVAAYSETTAAMDFLASKGFPKQKLVMALAACERGWQAKECVPGVSTAGLAPVGPITKETGLASYFELRKFGGKTIETVEGLFGDDCLWP